MKTARRIALGLVFLIASGCAQRADWIEGTLVTVDVNGVWRGRAISGIQGEMELTLVQQGAKVTGDALFRTTKTSIEGIVRGDVFSFAEPGGRLRAEATVTGDEMSGRGWTNLSPPFIGAFRLTLSRQP